MSNENVRAANEFRRMLQEQHRRGDEILADKGKLVKSHEEVCENLRSIIQEFRDLDAQASGADQAEALERILRELEDMDRGIGEREEEWEELERARKTIFELRKTFDRKHLERIEQGQTNAEVQGIPLLEELTSLHDRLKGDTADYVHAYFDQSEADEAMWKRLNEVEQHKLFSELKQKVSELLQRLAAAMQDRKVWIEAMDRQYVAVYTLDRKYLALRLKFERWEPLS